MTCNRLRIGSMSAEVNAKTYICRHMHDIVDFAEQTESRKVQIELRFREPTYRDMAIFL